MVLLIICAFCAFLWLFAFPADAVFCVFEDDATTGEFVTDFVGASEVTAPASFLVRCSRPTATDLPGMCLSERRIGGADVTVRFPRDWLADWRKVAEGVERLIAGIRPAGG